MKRNFLFILFFLCLEIVFIPNVFVSTKTTNANFENSKTYEIVISGKRFCFKEKEMIKETQLTRKQIEIIKNKEQKEILKKLNGMGFSKKEAVNYIFPETKIIEKKLKEVVCKEEKEDYVKVYKNECKIKIYKGEEGEFFDINNFYNEIYKQSLEGKNKIKIFLKREKYKNKSLTEQDFNIKSEFVTNFEKSSFERKNNIKRALESFDGIILEEGEVLSFNTVTGERNQNNGYMQAKIISGGTFVSGFGGGVCQVSTTLYNACLLAGLEILEVHSHSLPVSYIEPSFDAMVNSGSSDLVIRNNSGGKIIITTSFNEDKCRVKIFGKKNKYKITRNSEKTKIIPAKIERVETDYKKFGLENLNIGEEKRISYAKDGFYSNGYLKFYNEKGELIKTEKIRNCKYNPTEGVVVKREK